MSQVVYILGSVKNSLRILTLSKHPIKHKDYSKAVEEAKRLLEDNYDMTEVFIFKQITSVKKLKPALEVTELETQSDETVNEEPLVNILSEEEKEEEEEQPSDKEKEFEALKPTRPYKSPKMERVIPYLHLLSLLEPGEEFYHKSTYYRLLDFEYPQKAKALNLFTGETEDISSCVYVSARKGGINQKPKD